MGAEVEPMAAKEVVDNADDDSDDPVPCLFFYNFESILIFLMYLRMNGLMRRNFTSA